jgi:hypothetical protein
VQDETINELLSYNSPTPRENLNSARTDSTVLEGQAPANAADVVKALQGPSNWAENQQIAGVAVDDQPEGAALKVEEHQQRRSSLTAEHGSEVQVAASCQAKEKLSEDEMHGWQHESCSPDGGQVEEVYFGVV